MGSFLLLQFFIESAFGLRVCGVRVDGEETSMSWFFDGVSRNDGFESKFELEYVSEDGSPLEHSQRRTTQKSSFSEGAAGHSRTPASGNFLELQLLARELCLVTKMPTK